MRKLLQTAGRPIAAGQLALCLALMAIAPVVAAQDTKTSGIAPSAPADVKVSATSSWQVPDYIIGPDDVLDVQILDVPEFSREYRVSNSGTISLSILPNPVPAAGLTIPQFSEALSKELKSTGMIVDPHISVAVNQSKSHSVAITGAVKKPQVYPVFGQTTLLDVLSQAEGLADDASSVAVVRRGEIGLHVLQAGNTAKEGAGQKDSYQTATVDLKGLMENRDASLNIAIYPGDRITVPRAGIVYVVGAVNKPGGFTMRSNSHGMTVVQALALAENPKPTALPKQTVIIRSDPAAPQGRKQIPVDLKQVMSGKAPDTVLQAEDILFVPDSAGKRALRRGAEAALQITSGVLIYSSRF